MGLKSHAQEYTLDAVASPHSDVPQGEVITSYSQEPQLDNPKRAMH